MTKKLSGQLAWSVLKSNGNERDAVQQEKKVRTKSQTLCFDLHISTGAHTATYTREMSK